MFRAPLPRGLAAALRTGRSHRGFRDREYWSKTTRIDVTGLHTDGWTDLAECKWGAVRSAPSVESELDEKVKLYPNRRYATLGRRIFARRQRPGHASEDSDVRWHTLEDLYR